jgi:hypothetical protein
MTFNVGDWVLLWGQVARIVALSANLAVLEERDPPLAGRRERIRGLKWLAAHQGRWWEGSPVDPSWPIGDSSIDGRSWSRRAPETLPAVAPRAPSARLMTPVVLAWTWLPPT